MTRSFQLRLRRHARVVVDTPARSSERFDEFTARPMRSVVPVLRRR